MPVATEITVKASEVRKGDLVDGFTVTSTYRKVKWTHINFAEIEANQKVVKLDAEVTVTRQVRTDAENLADRLEMFVESTQRSTTKAVEAAAAAAAKMADAVGYGADSQWQYLQAYAEAVCDLEIWRTVERIHDNLDANEGTSPVAYVEQMRWVRAVNAMADDITERLVGNLDRPSSSSQMSNAMMITKNEKQAAWLRWSAGEARRLQGMAANLAEAE